MRATLLCGAVRPMIISRMRLLRKLSIAAGVVLLAHSAAAQNYQGKELVKASLVADTSVIVPGKPFSVGLLLRMAPGWHTYWKYAGDAGLPTEIKWNLPPGWNIGEIQWPITKRSISFRCRRAPLSSVIRASDRAPETRYRLKFQSSQRTRVCHRSRV